MNKSFTSKRGNYRIGSRGGMAEGTPTLWQRARDILILLLIAAVIALAVLGAQAMAYRTNAHELLVKRIQTECGDALTLTASLSRTAGANSSATLGRIRSHVYAMDTLNELNVGLEGGNHFFVDESAFTALYSVLDDYVNKLITGMVTGDLQTALTEQLNALMAQLNELR